MPRGESSRFGSSASSIRIATSSQYLREKTLQPLRQPDRHEVVTHVSDTIRYLCVRSGQILQWCRKRILHQILANPITTGFSPVLAARLWTLPFGPCGRQYLRRHPGGGRGMQGVKRGPAKSCGPLHPANSPRGLSVGSGPSFGLSCKALKWKLQLFRSRKGTHFRERHALSINRNRPPPRPRSPKSPEMSHSPTPQIKKAEYPVKSMGCKGKKTGVGPSI